MKASNTSKYECSKLRIPEVSQEFELELRNRFSCLEDNDHQTTADWDEGEGTHAARLRAEMGEFQIGFQQVSKDSPRLQNEEKSWITADSWKKIENRRAMKRMVDNAKSSTQKALNRLDKEVKVRSKGYIG